MGFRTYIQMVPDITLEAIDDGCGVIKECTDTRRRNLCSYTGKIDSMPLNELIFSTMIIVVLEVRS